jgi:hypothetical protein
MADLDPNTLNVIARVRKLRWTAVVCFATGVLLGLFQIMLPTVASGILFVATLCCMLVAVFVMTMVSIQLCPRCGEPLFLKWFLTNVFSSKCIHCGLCLHSREDGE